jgi:uncharacterized membrane protein YfcA
MLLSLRLLMEFPPWAKRLRPPAASGDMGLHLLPAPNGRVAFSYAGREHGFDRRAMLALAFVVGIIGGTYGIGGGAIIAPFCIAVFELPVYVVAGAALAGTFATSVVGVLVYSVLPLPGGGHAAPDWMLGTLFGLGGLAGMYLGAAAQRHIPQRVLKLGLGLLLAGLGLSYLL